MFNVKSVIQNITSYLIDPIEVCSGNIVIAKGTDNDTCFEIHYVRTKDIYLQTLIDDVWVEPLIWKNINSKYNSKVVIYLLESNINLEKEYMEIDNELNLSFHFSKIFKYFIFISDSLFKILSNKFPSSVTGKVISLPKINSSTNKNTSIITTVFNNAKLLEQTIQSVINQTNTNFEYIIKDAGSTDNFNEVIQKYAPYISKVISNPDKGIYYGMNEGVQHSTGSYFAFLNSDDIYLKPDILETYNQTMQLHKSDAYYANIVRRSTNGEPIVRKGSLRNIYRESSINHPTLFLKRIFYDKIGGFDLSLRYAADGDQTIKLLKAGCSFFYIDQSMILFRIGGASTLSYQSVKEELICRYRYNKLNIFGYLYIILRSLKSIFKNQIKK